MLYDAPVSYRWVASARRAYEPAAIQDEMSPCVIVPRIVHSPSEVGATSETYATPCGVPALIEKSSCGRSNDVVVSRLIWPVIGRSAKSADARRAGLPTARARLPSGLSRDHPSGISATVSSLRTDR